LGSFGVRPYSVEEEEQEMPRINTVKKARKAQGTCGKCGKAIKAGDAYKWIKPRYGAKKVRCEDCAFRSSDLTSSDKLSRVYEAQETAQDAVNDWDGEDAQELKSILETAAEEIREVAQEYQDSADAIMEHFPSGNQTSEECEERAQELEGWADTLDDFEPEEFEPEDEDDDPDAEENGNGLTEVSDPNKSEADEDEELACKKEEWAEEQRGNAHVALDECPV
jgi:hypothetical protein